MASQKIEPFDTQLETFARYIQRVEIQFAATDVAAAKQKYVFLNSLSRKHYTLLANLVSPADPDTKSFEELVETLSKHFQPKSSIISERYSFHCRCQEPDESLPDFVASLTKLIVRCDYEPQFQTVLLRDRFVCGLSNESTRKRLLTENDTLKLERGLLSVWRKPQYMQMKSDIKSTSVYQLNSKHPPSQFSSSPTCHRCGGPHLAPACRFIN